MNDLHKSTVGRSGPGARDGAAHLDQIKEIKKTLPYITIIANGNVKTYEDCLENLEETAADGEMRVFIVYYMCEYTCRYCYVYCCNLHM
jgi:hypothetical protein